MHGRAQEDSVTSPGKERIRGSSPCLLRCGAILSSDPSLTRVVQITLQRENLYSPTTEHTLLMDGHLIGTMSSSHRA